MNLSSFLIVHMVLTHMESTRSCLCFVEAFQQTFLPPTPRLAGGAVVVRRHGRPPFPNFVTAPTPIDTKQSRSVTLLARADESSDGDDSAQDGAMADAFRQLESLDAESLLGDAVGDQANVSPTPITTSISMGEGTLAAPEPPSLETEAKVYQDYLQEVEGKSDEDLYGDMLSDMGGSSSPSRSKAPTSSSSSSAVGSSSSVNNNNDELWNRALEEAMEDVKLNNPGISDSIMDDAGFRKEIEAIFERGNDKLLESLEEIRREQVRVRSFWGWHASIVSKLTLAFYFRRKSGPRPARIRAPKRRSISWAQTRSGWRMRNPACAS
jgi:hypothetical protein